MHHLILASMAATDLAVGIVIQPVFIAREIARLTDGLLLVYCNLSKKINGDNISPLPNVIFSDW